MQEVAKKKRRTLRHGRRWLLLASALALALVGGAWALFGRAVPEAPIEAVDESGELWAYDEADVTRLAVARRDGDSWEALRQSDGLLALSDCSAISESRASSLLQAAAVIAYDRVLTDDPAEYRDRLSEFGLDDPRLIVEIGYADGRNAVLRIGDEAEGADTAFSYMTADGDDRLFALDQGTADALSVTRASLHPVEQPTLHKARFDRITLTDAAGDRIAEWVLSGSIGDTDARDEWFLTVPVRYPADAELLDSLRENLSSFRLGAYMGEATAERLAACGLDQPRFILTAHQAAGSIGTTGSAGVYDVTDWPEDTFTLSVGDAQSDVLDYVRYGDGVYLANHYYLDGLLDFTPALTASRYLIPVALGNLTSLTVQTAEATAVYTICREEQVAPNNELVTDASGDVIYDTVCLRDGEAIDYASFEAAYNQLLIATVSGALPEGWTATEPPHTTLTFTDVSGDTRIVALARFDALHDAVLIDGNAMFYLIRDGLRFDVP